MVQQSHYDALDTPTLTNLLLNADQPADVHRGALSALARRSAYQRSQIITQILRSVIRIPDRYDQDVMMALIDILATDPQGDATETMISVLPEIIESGLDSSHPGLKPEFRNYFYQALVTRQREGDLEVWGDMLPELDAKTLVGALIDPAAGPLEALEPLTLINRLPEPQRTKALTSVIAGIVHTGADPKNAQKAAALLAESSDRAQLAEGVLTLGQQWERAKKSGRKSHVEVLESALRLIDGHPRSPTERLTGKRPWAP